MLRLTLIISAGLAIIAGCSEPVPGRSRDLGAVNYDDAFAAASKAVSQYFSIESADPAGGLITSRPKPADAPGERLLGASPARKLAVVRIRRRGDRVIAHASVALQRQGSAVFRQSSPPAENYEGLPYQTPAQLEGATTAEQNQAWRTERYDHPLEITILDDLYKSLHPPAESEPAEQ